MKNDGNINQNEIENSHRFMLIVFFLTLLWSVIKPFSFITWLLQALPAIIMVLVLSLLFKHFKFSEFVYYAVLIHVVILLIGSKYTYERNPLFDVLMEKFDLNRNYYDRIGHLAQGFTPAIIAKEYLLREGYLKKSKIFYYIVMSIVLAVSAAYELLEFAASRISGVPAEKVLSFQGDIWDTQWDMVMALIGATVALTVFRRIHDKSMKKIEKEL